MQNMQQSREEFIPPKTSDLYAQAVENGIDVYAYPLRESFSICVKDDDGHCAIALRRRLNKVEERTCLAHEMGHCMTGSFYNRYASAGVRGKCEYKADKWAFDRMLPQRALRRAIDAGIEAPWELAEYFGVSEAFVRDALYHYANVTALK